LAIRNRKNMRSAVVHVFAAPTRSIAQMTHEQARAVDHAYSIRRP
jgi:hypothetical protein